MVSFIATDTHSVVHRPPMLKEALDAVAQKFGDEYREMFIKNTDYLYRQIIAR